MLVFRFLIACCAAAMLLPLGGCKVVSRSQWRSINARQAELLGVNEAQTARIANLQTHCRSVEDLLMRTEEDLALLEEQYEVQGTRLANYRDECDRLRRQLAGEVPGGDGVAPEVGSRLATISRQFSSLQFDPQTGISRLDADILFDEGSSALSQGAEDVLTEMADVLNAPEARDLRLLVVGRTDDRPSVGQAGKHEPRNGFQLSADRALAVSRKLAGLGLDMSRIGVAGFGPHHAVAPDGVPSGQQKNRGVEIFVIAPEVPVIGWRGTLSPLY